MVVRVAAFVALFAACGGGRAPRTFELDDGTRVEVSGRGGLTLVDGDRELFSLTDKEAPRIHRFTEVERDFSGLWEFDRGREQVTPLGRFLGAREVDGGVELRYRARGEATTATLTVSSERPGEATRVRLEVSAEGGAPTSIAIPARCDPGGGFYGFGEQYDQLDHRGESLSLFVSEQGIGRDPEQPVLLTNGGRHTTYFPMPYYLDPRGFGVLLRTARRAEADLCDSDPDVAWLEVISGEPLELVVFHGPEPLDVIRQLGDEVGRPKNPPDWAFEPWMMAQGGRDAVLAEAAALRDADIPTSALWIQDWTGARQNLDGGYGVQYRWLPDETLYPDLAGLTAELKTQGFHSLAYVNPFVDTGLEHFSEMAASGLTIHDQDGEPYVHFAPSGDASEPDLTNADARDYVEGFLKAMVEDYGFDGWMADFGEWLPLDAVYADGSNPVAAHNRYPVEWERLSREVMDEVRPDGDWAVFGRSGFTGVQSYSMIHWCGDQETSFDADDGLATVVPAMLSLGLSGVPYVTHDIAGFSSVHTDPSDMELFVRWTELGALTPIMRTHDGSRRADNWRWDRDADTTAQFRRLARLHQALAPEFRALADDAAETSAPILRPLFVGFPGDEGSRSVSDEFLIGDSLLVAPVLERGATTRRLYLPPGTWFHLWSGDSYDGGREIEVDVPLGEPPVFSLDRDRPDLRDAAR